MIKSYYQVDSLIYLINFDKLSRNLADKYSNKLESYELFD